MKGEEVGNQGRSFLSVQRITQEDIICEGDKGDHLLQSVVCPVCLMLLPMPHYVCQSCDNAFCGGCLENWWEKNPNSCIFKCKDSQFKLIKRSNTYNALMEILKTRCKYCIAPIPILQLEAHDKTCGKKPINCSFEDCKSVIPREDIEKHKEICEFRRVKCEYCKKLFFKKDIYTHQITECEEREVVCVYKQCGALINIRQAGQHQISCLFKPDSCSWCKETLFLKDKISHERMCPLRLAECQWCREFFKPEKINDHKQQCSKRQVTCELCSHTVPYTSFKDHKVECMFANMVLMKHSQAQIIEQNVKLKQKVHELEFELQQAIKQNQQGAFNALIRVKEEEKAQFEKDLARLNNGIANIQKLRNAEMTEHLKKPHLSSSLCPFCNAIRSKLEEDLAPLLKQKEQVTNKLNEVERLRLATVSSKVKMSRIRE